VPFNIYVLISKTASGTRNQRRGDLVNDGFGRLCSQSMGLGVVFNVGTDRHLTVLDRADRIGASGGVRRGDE